MGLPNPPTRNDIMKRLSLLIATSMCAFAYTSSAFAVESAADAASEAVDPNVSGVLPSDAASGSASSDPTADADSDLDDGMTSDTREAKNAIYLDIAGPGLLYAINYDRVIVKDVSARIGFSYFSLGASAEADAGSASVEFSYLAIPLTASYLGLGSESNMFELGGGGVIMNFSGSGIVEAEDAEVSAGESVTTLAFTALAGYRHQPADGGFVFRIGASPLLVLGANVIPTGYLSLGAAF